MNKLKDFLYDHTDIILSLFVIIAIVFIVETNFTIFDQGLSSFSGQSDNSGPSNNNISVTDEKEPSPRENKEQQNLSPDTDSENSQDNNSVIISVPQGASASDVGEALLKKDLINSTSEFIEKTESLNVSHQLKPGEFKIPQDATLEEMIQILIQSNL